MLTTLSDGKKRAFVEVVPYALATAIHALHNDGYQDIIITMTDNQLVLSYDPYEVLYKPKNNNAESAGEKK